MSTTELQQSNRDRIVNFLRTKVPIERFDLNKLQVGQPKEELPNLTNIDCGTVGCAIGWTPSCLPEQVGFERVGRDTFTVVHLETGEDEWDDVAALLFGITANIAYDLFNTDLMRSEPFVPNHYCGFGATPKDVAARLEAYFKAHP